MPRVCVPGRYTDFPTDIIIDTTIPQSTVSTQFACTNNIPRNVVSICGVAYTTCSGPVVVPTVDGWFSSRLPFKISHIPQRDVILGADWINACQPQFVNGGLLRPSENIISHLPTGHSWSSASSVTTPTPGAFSITAHHDDRSLLIVYLSYVS